MGRWLEFLIVAVLFVASSPVQLIVAGLLLATLGQPLMFRQNRVGRGGRAIIVPKYRTMSDARDEAGELLPDTERQTRLTWLLRRLRLDELPQLGTILRGHMALVGPRPLLAETVAGFGQLGALRNMVRPGLTGWAQVNGNTRLSDEEKLALDLWYVAHRSTALDLRILRDTVRVALWGEKRNETRLRDARIWLQQNTPSAPEATP